MKTEIVSVDKNMDRIIETFHKHPVPFPSETVYGLGAIAWREDLIKKVFEIKNRPADNPLIVHASSLEMVKECIEKGDIPEIYEKVIEMYWPGPLTLLFKRSKRIPNCVTAGGEYVAIRVPDHKETLLVLDKLNCPIVGPSANKSTRPSPTTAEHVLDDLNGEVPLIIDGGRCRAGVESTVINGLTDPPIYLRAGAISYEELKREIKNLALSQGGDKHKEEIKACPGMRYKHYSPVAPVYLITGSFQQQIEKIEEIIDNININNNNNNNNNNINNNTNLNKNTSDKIGFLLTEEQIKHIKHIKLKNRTNNNIMYYSLGENIEDAAHRVFDGLRLLDRHTNMIYACAIEETGIGRAVMDRLTRAATKKV